MFISCIKNKMRILKFKLTHEYGPSKMLVHAKRSEIAASGAEKSCSEDSAVSGLT